MDFSGIQRRNEFTLAVQTIPFTLQMNHVGFECQIIQRFLPIPYHVDVEVCSQVQLQVRTVISALSRSEESVNCFINQSPSQINSILTKDKLGPNNNEVNCQS